MYTPQHLFRGGAGDAEGLQQKEALKASVCQGLQQVGTRRLSRTSALWKFSARRRFCFPVSMEKLILFWRIHLTLYIYTNNRTTSCSEIWPKTSLSFSLSSALVELSKFTLNRVVFKSLLDPNTSDWTLNEAPTIHKYYSGPFIPTHLFTWHKYRKLLHAQGFLKLLTGLKNMCTAVTSHHATMRQNMSSNHASSIKKKPNVLRKIESS